MKALGPWVLAVAALSTAGDPTRAAPQTGTSRTIVILSDLHMGPGRAASREWHPYEDFRWASELTAFLKTIDEATEPVDLVLNGDTFELLQSPTVACTPAVPEAGCSESAVLARLDRVLTAHQEEVRALSAFARSGSNRLVILPGDHDAALLLPAVRRRIVGAMGIHPGRVDAPASGSWTSADGRVHVEHGHQMAFSPHRFDPWPSPFRKRDGRLELTRPWGERAIQELFDLYEERYPVVDNVAVLGSGVKYALAAAGVSDLEDRAPALLRYVLSMMSWQQFRMELDDGEVLPPAWDLAQVRAQSAAFLVSSVPDDDPFKPIAVRALADGRLAKQVGELTDEQIVALCDHRAAIRRARRRFEPALSQLPPRGPVVSECPRMPDSRGGIYEYFWRSRDEQFLRHLEAVAGATPNQRPVSVFVHGHTHLPDRAQDAANMISGGLLKIPMEGFSPVRGALTPVVINGGAFQRTITPVQLESMARDRGQSAAALLGTLRPEQLAPCYSFVRIGPYSDAPAPQVRYWRPSADGRWLVGAGCGR
jgi:UDP-2,3-diacylglucosamine pyrophosphatase LpxH